ncbi:DUF4345 family protein [Nocardioides sp. HB32]
MRDHVEGSNTMRPDQTLAAGPDPARLWVARIALLALAAAGLYQGLWAQLAPQSFFQDFPNGMGWVATEGPYNEHLVRDIGGLVNGMAVVALVAAWRPSRPLFLAAGLGWLVYSVPHFVFHLSHPLDDSSMQALNVVVLVTEILLPLLGLLGATASARETR